MSNSDRTPSSCKNYTQGHSSKMTSMWVKRCLWRCCTAIKCLCCTCPTKPRFGTTMATRVKKANKYDEVPSLVPFQSMLVQTTGALFTFYIFVMASQTIMSVSYVSTCPACNYTAAHVIKYPPIPKDKNLYNKDEAGNI